MVWVWYGIYATGYPPLYMIWSDSWNDVLFALCMNLPLIHVALWHKQTWFVLFRLKSFILPNSCVSTFYFNIKLRSMFIFRSGEEGKVRKVTLRNSKYKVILLSSSFETQTPPINNNSIVFYEHLFVYICI